MELRRGITGFRHVDEPDLPVCDLSAFRAHCHAAARSVGGRVVQNANRLCGTETNFALAVLEISNVQVAVLLNCHFPVIAFTATPDERPLRFVDGGKLADAFKATGEYEVMSRAELEHSIGERDFDDLAPAELEQVEYWKPVCVGDVVFNFWD